MKIDEIDKNKSFSKRLIHDFTNSLFDLLQKKRLEKITIGELCKQTNYPRSTFYNYFEDIYALMDYCWQYISEQAHIDFQNIEHDNRTLFLFEQVYDYMEAHRKIIDMLLEHNPANGAMLMSFNRYIKKTIYQMIMECPLSYKYPLPHDLIAQHYSNTVQMILSSCFLNKTIEKKDAISYMNFLLGTLEKASTLQ